MSKAARIQTQVESVNRPSRTCDWPKSSKTGNNAYISEIFGSQVFGLSKLQEALPKTVYARFIQQLKVKKKINKG
jgi:glutamine synthetase